jgi:hypothetical protein
MIMSECVDDLDHEMLSHIILSLKHSIQPTVYNPVRKIYMPEFMEIIESGLIPNQTFTESVTVVKPPLLAP